MSILPLRWDSILCVVAEVGYHNERNFDEVKTEVDLWVSFGVLVVIGIKITNIETTSVENPVTEIIAKIQGHEDQVFTLSHDVPTPCVCKGMH
jgi:hypothetical protein